MGLQIMEYYEIGKTYLVRNNVCHKMDSVI